MVIDHVQDVLKSAPNHEGFAFFYCNRNEKSRRQPLSVLQSYVRQLSTVTSNPEHMQTKLRKLCNEMEQNGSDLRFDTCRQLILESVNLYPKTTLVVDALDECEPESRWQLVRMIEDLLLQSERPLKVFISSRPDGDIRDCFLARPSIQIQATDNQHDIEKFVNEQIDKPRQWGKVSASLRRDIVKIVLDRCNGM